jgi:hypothetical protein
MTYLDTNGGGFSLVVPGSIYRDALDPRATDVPDEAGWPQAVFRRRGSGTQYVYARLSREQVEEIIEHVRDRADGLAYGADPDPVYRRSQEWCEQVEDELLARGVAR